MPPEIKKGIPVIFLSGLAEPVGALVGYLILMPFLNDVILACCCGVAVWSIFLLMNCCLQRAAWPCSPVDLWLYQRYGCNSQPAAFCLNSMAEREQEMKRASWIGIIGNALLSVTKIVAGFISGSLVVVV
jgi:hypothetical protein